MLTKQHTTVPRTLVVALLFVLSSFAVLGGELVDKVNPFVDTHKSRWFFFNSASRPFGLVSLNPDTATKGSWKSGYMYDSLTVKCFSHVHNWQMSGVAVMPATGGFKANKGMDAYQSRFSHEGEIAKPGYHKLYLEDYGVTAELSCTQRVGFHRYTYPESDSSQIIFDTGAYLAHSPTEFSQVWLVDDHTVAGYQICAPTSRRPKPVSVYFYAVIDKRIERTVFWKEQEVVTPKTPLVCGKDAGMAVFFHTREGEAVQMKVGVSFTSVENARLNLLDEAEGIDFEQAKNESIDEWEDMLSRIRVEGGSEEQQVKFYTDLWHSLLGRHKVSDSRGSYADNTGPYPIIRQIPLNEQGKPLYDHYNFDAWWGSHWSLNILWTMVYPEIVDAFCNTMLDYYSNGGLIPRGPSGGNYTYVMIGDPAVSFFAAAINKGIRGFDTKKAYEGLRKNAFEGGIRDHAGYEHSADACSGGMKYYQSIGYVPEDRPEKTGNHVGGASMTLEYAYQDWCLSQIALALGKEQDYEFFLDRSASWRNVWDAGRGYMNGRLMNGEFLEDFDPLEISESDGFCESNAAIYSHYVPHDVPSLIEVHGGRKAYIDKLNTQFELSEPGGFLRVMSEERKSLNWADYGNQPGTGMAHLFSYAGAPYLTQKWVRKVKAAYSDITPYGGYRDDEDQGQMGALGVLMAIGLFEEDGGCRVDPYYEICSPVFDRISISLNPDYYPGGKFEIICRNNSDKNMYIQRAWLNSQKWDKCIFPHDTFANGGSLVLEMGPRPNRSWGADTFGRH